MSSIQTRLQDPGYINWVKACLCLIHTKEGLEDFADNESKTLHGNILAHPLPNTGHSLGRTCISKNKLKATCGDAYCQSFVTAVIQEGIDPHHKITIGKPNLAKTDAGQWHSQPWELAKLFMNPGKRATQTQTSQTDLSGIINFLSQCRVPINHVTNVDLLDEVRETRNEVMHTSDMKVSATDLRKYTRAMTDLLQDPGIYCYPRAQLAVTHIRKIFNSADFQITLEDESKVMERLSESLKALVVEIRAELTDMAECGREDRGNLGQLQDEFQKVSDSYATLEQRVCESSTLQERLETNLTNVKKLLEMTNTDILELETRIAHLETDVHNIQQQQEEHTEDIRYVKKQQHVHTEDICNVQEEQKTHGEEIASLERRQDKTDHFVDSLKMMTTQQQGTKPLEKDQADLQQYLKDIYLKKLDVNILPKWIKLNVSQIFSPLSIKKIKRTSSKATENILKKEDGPGNNALSQEGNTTLMSFKDMFEDVSGSRAPKSPTFLLGKAGDGKSTFCKYLTNAWACPNGSTQQFLDANVLEQFKYLFFVSCRFAKEEESIFDMIENQLFCQKDVSMKRTAKHMLEHRPELCLIVVDGLDEWKGSATSDTGRPEDIEGLPSFNGVEKCTLFITSRHWRFYALEEHIRTQSIQLVIDGLRNEAQLVEHTLQLLNDPEPKQSRDAFLLQIEENDMTELKESPLMLIMAIDLWKNEGSLCKSLCMNYVKIVRSFIYRAEGQSGWPTTEKRVSVPINYSENDPSFIKWPSCFSVSKQYHSLLLLLGHLAFDHLIGRKEQSLVFSKDECQSYLYDEGDEKINVCLALGILSKTATTVLGIEKIETYSFPHKMFQEFFAAMWLAIKYTDEKSKLYQTIRTMESVFDYEILIRFLCGLNPEAGKEFWIYVTKKDIGADPLNLYEYDPRDDNIYKSIQTLILQSVKESRNCSGKEAEHIYYQLPVIWIDGKTLEEEKTVIFNTMEHYNETQYLHSSMLNANYQSMLSSVSHALFIQVLRLGNISSSNDCLDLQHHGMLKLLILDDLPIRDLILPSEGSQLRVLKLWGLALSHTSMEHLYSSISSSSNLKSLELIRLACHDNSCRDTCSLSVLDLTYRHGLHELKLDQLPISNLILPKDMELKLSCMTLCDLNLSHKSLEQLCSSISCLSNLNKLILSNLCRDHSCSDTCCSIVLDLKPHQVLSYLKLCQIPISDLILRSNDHSQLENLKLCDLTLTHKSIEQFSISLWGPSVLECLEVTNWSCRDHSCSTACCLSVLDLQFNNNLMELTLDKLPISELKIPCDEDSNLGFLSLYDISLTHKSLEELCSDLNFPEALVSVDLLNLSCRDHSSSNTCSLPELDLQNQYNLSNLRLFNIPVEGLLLPTAMTDTVIDLRFANMKVDGWRNFIDALAVTEIDNVVIVILTSCNIDSDTRKIISNSPQFCVTHDDDSLVEFEVVKSGTHSESENDTDNGWMAIEILNSDTHSDSESEECTGCCCCFRGLRPTTNS